MNIALVYGGRSTEHTVSINSARTIHTSLLQAGYSVILIGITLDGIWYLQGSEVRQELETKTAITAVAGKGFFVHGRKLDIDAVFATTHGYGGEDGNLQGLCMLCRLPLCGSDTVSSALGMHKDLAAGLFDKAGIPTVPTMVLDRESLKTREPLELWEQACNMLGSDLFVKPENSGSSVGVKALKQSSASTLDQAIEEAKCYSERVLIQPLVKPLMEVEAAVLQTEDHGLVVAGPGLVIDPAKDNTGFLSYAHKYGQVDTAHILIPSGLDKEIESLIRRYALTAFKAIKADGYARVDFFVSSGKVYLNEINTSPGMTDKSHYPALMASIGYDLPSVCKQLVADALRRSDEEQQRTYTPPKE